MTKLKNNFTLREKKYAKTKIALASEFIKRMKTTRLSEISIKEVCQKVEVSEGTFYNYFPHKINLVYYFNKFTILKAIWKIETKKEKLSNIEIIEHVFDILADEIQNQFLFYEVISLYTSEHTKLNQIEDLTIAEKVYGFPNCPGIEKIKVITLENYFTKIIEQARERKQISPDIPVEDIVHFLISTLIGIPSAIDMEDFGKLKRLYRIQLFIFWKGLSKLNIKKRK